MKQNQKVSLLSTALSVSIVCLTWINATAYSSAESLSNPPNFTPGKEIESVQQEPSELPTQVKSAVIEAASQQTSREVAYLKILESQPREWSDGCLGIAEPGTVCIQQVISGWQVKVTDGIRNWTFRTNKSGDLVKLEESTE